MFFNQADFRTLPVAWDTEGPQRVLAVSHNISSQANLVTAPRRQEALEMAEVKVKVKKETNLSDPVEVENR